MKATSAAKPRFAGPVTVKLDLADRNRIEDVSQLDEVMSRPSEALVRELQSVPGDIMVLGVGGKMGPTNGWRIAAPWPR